MPIPLQDREVAVEHMSHEEHGGSRRFGSSRRREPATAETAEERAKRVAELRERWLNGTIDDVLFPEDMNLDRLVKDLAALPDEVPDDESPSRPMGQGRQR